jgi:hypothetical protein
VRHKPSDAILGESLSQIDRLDLQFRHMAKKQPKSAFLTC